MLKTLLVLIALLLTPALAQRTVPLENPEGIPDGIYMVVRNIDGDTLAIAHEGVVRSVRLIAASTPEIRPLQPFGREAAAFTALYAAPGTPVMLVGEGPRVDKFGRGLAHVLLLSETGQPSTPLALMLLASGLARADIREGAAAMRGVYEAAEAGAKSARKGLWTSDRTPWADKNCRDFRTQLEAQWFALSAATPQARDKNRLDPDNNGVACGRLPRAAGGSS